MKSEKTISYEEQRKLDEKLLADSWEKLKKQAGGGEVGERCARALKDYMSIFKSGAVEWLAHLYDHETGAFYYSNSARDNATVEYKDVTYDLLPDIESTEQALYLLESSGMITSRQDELPLDMQQKIARFVKNLQNPNGYFYHPQWGIEKTNKNISRRGRDLSNAEKILKGFGYAPTYDSPLGTKGDGLLFDGTQVAPCKIENSKTDDTIDTASPKTVSPFLENEQSFREFVNNLNINDDSYSVGSRLVSISREIVARDKVLKAEGKNYSFVEILGDYLDAHCNPETGHWGQKMNYDGLNGLMKTVGVYNAFSRPLPYPEKSAKAACEAITTDEEPLNICYPFNAWYGLCFVISNISRFNPDAVEIKERVRAYLFEHIEEVMEATKKNMLIFQKEDGTFSQLSNRSSHISMGMPVAPFGINEGDVNSTLIGVGLIPETIYSILKLDFIPVYTKSDFMRFIDIIEEKIHSAK